MVTQVDLGTHMIAPVVSKSTMNDMGNNNQY